MKNVPAPQRMQEAARALASCRVLLDTADRIGACNRAYYAAFYAAHAALQAVDAIKPGVTIKTHKGLVHAFGKKIVQPGLVPADLGRSLSRLLDLRILSDYDGGDFSADQANDMAERATAFVAAIRAALPMSRRQTPR